MPTIDEGAPVKFQVNRDVFSEAVSFAVKLLPQRTTQPILSRRADRGDRRRARRSRPSTTRYPSQTEIAGRRRRAGHGPGLRPAARRDRRAGCRTRRSSSSTEDGRIVRQLRLRALHPAVDAGRGVPDDPRGRRRSPGSCPPRTSPPPSRRSPSPRRATTSPRCITGVQLEVGDNSLEPRRHRPLPRRRARDRRGTAAASPARTPSPRWSRRARCSEVGKTFGHRGTSRSRSRSRDDRELIAFTADKKTVTSLLIKGNFPPVRRLFPETVDNYAVMNTAELIEAVRRVVARARARGRAALQLHDRRAHARGDRLRAGPGVRDDRRASSPATTPSSRSSRSSCSTASAPCTPSSCASRSPRPRTPTSPAPCSSRARRRATRPAPTTTSTCCSRTCCCAEPVDAPTSAAEPPSSARSAASDVRVPAVGGRG